jgi:hypothetical protein
MSWEFSSTREVDVGFLGRPDKGALLTAIRQFKAELASAVTVEDLKVRLEQFLEELEKAFA